MTTQRAMDANNLMENLSFLESMKKTFGVGQHVWASFTFCRVSEEASGIAISLHKPNGNPLGSFSVRLFFGTIAELAKTNPSDFQKRIDEKLEVLKPIKGINTPPQEKPTEV